MSKRLLILLAILTVLVAAVILSATPHDGNNSGQENALIFPDLQQHLNDIQRIDIAQGKVIFSIVRDKDGVWHIKDKDNYLANRVMVRDVIGTYSRTYFVEKRSAKKENYKTLGLDEAFMRRVAFYGSDPDKPLAALYVGLQKAARGGTFVRKPGEAQTWLAYYNLAPTTTPGDWIDKHLLAITDGEIKSIVISHGDAPEVYVHREKPGSDIRLDGLPKDKELKDPMELTNFFNLFNPLEPEDVRAASELSTPSRETTTITLFDGREITLHFFQDGDDKWVTIGAEYHPADAIPAVDPKKTKEKVDPEIFVKNLSKQTNGFAYKLPYNSAKKLTSNIKDLIK